MKYYFYSPVRGAIFSGGRALGYIFQNVCTVDDVSDNIFTIRIKGFQPCTVSRSFSENVKEFDFYFGKLFIPELKPTFSPYEFLEEKRGVFGNNEVIARLFREGSTKIEVSFYRTSAIFSLPFAAEKFDMKDCGNSILFETGNRIKHISLLSLKTFRRIFSSSCVDYRINDGLYVDKLVFCPSAHIYSCKYEITDKASLVATSLNRLEEFFCPSDLFMCYAFLLQIKYDGEYPKYLSPALAGKADVIKKFFGEIEYVLPPVEREYPTTFTIIGKNKVSYVDFSVEDGKICDVNVELFLKPNK